MLELHEVKKKLILSDFKEVKFLSGLFLCRHLSVVIKLKKEIQKSYSIYIGHYVIVGFVMWSWEDPVKLIMAGYLLIIACPAFCKQPNSRN